MSDRVPTTIEVAARLRPAEDHLLISLAHAEPAPEDVR